ncbi:Alanine dehydrogenase [Rubripirellula amarantea]|uniref:Alanine dehydrogenase n=1 Tax=Rubripirellula amarantea TaxID=2527999 RepID=A0A5C5WRI0_9BACT|nr:alanine dehydrogenase [Rubripirellula amarantea]TWT53060.1 Alanine dehydrogenase [Rubripirellula amarantea]
MIIGVPREVKSDEYRVAMLPVGAEELVSRGHRVIVEAGAGLGSGLPDHDYLRAGAEMAASGRDVFEQADLIVKVKEPQPEEYGLIRTGQVLFTYFHFAASLKLTDAMLNSGASCLAYETLRDEHGRLPLLTPMSEVAGRMSIQEGAKYLEKPQMGRGILLGGIPGVAPAHITVLGGGIVGANAARIAAGFQADVAILDVNLDRLRYLDDVMPANVNTLYSDRHNILDQLERADLVIGSVLIPGAKAPRLVRAEDLSRMKAGSVIVDVAVDQGGCFETTRPTTHGDPTFVVDEVVHYCVANMPGAVGRTSTYGLCNATISWIARLAEMGIDSAIKDSLPLRRALNVHAGKVTNAAVAAAFDLEFQDEV